MLVAKKSTLILALAATAALPGIAVAGNRDPGVNQRQHHQQQRIQQGVQSGELTRGETRRLEAEQRGIRQEERRYTADGQLTRAERADLHRDQNHASRDIYRQKHDAQDRPPAAVRDPGVNAHQRDQHDRIAEGVRSGSLTKDEAKGLRAEQRSIRQEERQYKSDGVLTRDERKDLRQDLNVASRNIYSEKHDAEVR
jgi:CRISPR/Cas system-associated endoribonuclease Cas2